MIEGEGKHSVRHHQPRCGSKRLAHGASVMEDAPGIDDVKRPERSEIIAVERRPLLNGPIGVAGEIKIPQAAGTEYRAYVVIEGMNARTEPARGKREQPAAGASIHEACALETVALQQPADGFLRLADLISAQIAGEIEPVFAEPESAIILFLIQHAQSTSGLGTRDGSITPPSWRWQRVRLVVVQSIILYGAQTRAGSGAAALAGGARAFAPYVSKLMRSYRPIW